MVMALDDENHPQPWSNKKNPVATSTMETRTSTKTSATKQKEQNPIFSTLHVARKLHERRLTVGTLNKKPNLRKNQL
jgi:hypothetical protein